MHRLGEGESLRLGGVDVPHNKKLLGHSDSDVLMHAVIDALLGAAGLGDIGDRFPDTDPDNKDRDSAEMLGIVLRRVDEAGWGIVNVDTIIFAERPRLSPHKHDIKQRLAQLLDIPPQMVGVKAKTAEGLGPIGEQLAIAAQCVVLLAIKS